MTTADIAGWIAPAATALAAIMTAANLGARVTGWGFVVFLIGSLAWSTVGASTGQTNLLATNGFLTIVNLIGIWRWLGRQARYEQGAARAVQASAARPAPDLLTYGRLIGAQVSDQAGQIVGETIEVLVDCESHRIAYVVIRSGGLGGVGERLRAVARQDLTIGSQGIVLALSHDGFERLDDWVPEAPPPLPRAAAAA
ncbi:PRC-barrel domain-containing protein [Sphingomonas crocodyli]|uniref:PRC-barrel domain containing protein n=1 Tax=Sphingomonas crocodyli TaxID=1979270 RepID=A0A437LY91_9SPHN|nr:PRC-barrel domain-containing protein [Sphingomonas crocodyli]RVT90380.1 PRC-barrel domain containing protein [Sphingomonas crocodyli]